MLGSVKYYLLPVLFVCASTLVLAQKLFFEPTIGTAATEYYGNHIVADSIVIENWRNDYSGIRELRTIGINVGYIISPRFETVLALSFYNLGPSYGVYNANQNLIFNQILIKKGGSQSFRDIQVGLRPQFTFLKIKQLKLLAFAEISLHFNINRINDYTPISDFNGKFPMVATVLNSIAAAPGKTFVSWGYGWSVNYKRLSLSARYTENLSNTYTNDLEIEGINYPFINHFKRLSFTLGYKFYFRKKNKEEE